MKRGITALAAGGALWFGIVVAMSAGTPGPPAPVVFTPPSYFCPAGQHLAHKTSAKDECAANPVPKPTGLPTGAGR